MQLVNLWYNHAMTKPNKPSKTLQDQIGTAEPLATLTLPDYHPIRRGRGWIYLFSLVFFAIAGGFYFFGDLVAAFTFLVAMGVYLWLHQNQNGTVDVAFYAHGVVIGQIFFASDRISGYEVVEGDFSRVVHLNLQGNRWFRPRILLQMADVPREFFDIMMEQMKIKRLPDRKETAAETWIRVLQL